MNKSAKLKIEMALFRKQRHFFTGDAWSRNHAEKHAHPFGAGPFTAVTNASGRMCFAYACCTSGAVSLR